MNESDFCGCRKSSVADRTGHASSHLRLPQMIQPRDGGIDLCGVAKRAADLCGSRKWCMPYPCSLRSTKACEPLTPTSTFAAAANGGGKREGLRGERSELSDKARRSMAVTITLTNASTIALLELYRQYVGDVDLACGSISELAEGLVIASLDEHNRFRQWRRQNPAEVQAA